MATRYEQRGSYEESVPYLCVSWLLVRITILLAFVNMSSSSPATDTNTTKTVYFIRHAESEENRRIASLGTVFGDLRRLALPKSQDVMASCHLLHVPAQVDSSVSENGKAQIANMAEQLRAANFLETAGVQVVVHSPLIRAQETSEGLLQCRAGTGGSPEQKDPSVKRVEVLDMLREKTPAEWIPGNIGSLRKRMDAFEDWLAAQPERVIAVVGHSQYFKAILNLSYKFRNCDVWKIQFDASKRQQSSLAVSSEKDVLPPQWSGLENSFECTFTPNEK